MVKIALKNFTHSTLAQLHGTFFLRRIVTDDQCDEKEVNHEVMQGCVLMVCDLLEKLDYMISEEDII